MLYFLASNNYPELNNRNVFVNVYGSLPIFNRLPIDGELSSPQLKLIFSRPRNVTISRRGVAIHTLIEVIFSGHFGLHVLEKGGIPMLFCA
jgi:hypothetical protein